MTPGNAHWTPPGRPENLGDGTDAPRPETYATPFLRAHADAMASHATRRFYEVWPGLRERYGARGEQHTYEDQFWHLSTMDTALKVGSPQLFDEYLAWLRGFLAGRGMKDDVACANFLFFREAVTGLDGAEPVLGLIEGAIAAFPPEARVIPG